MKTVELINLSVDAEVAERRTNVLLRWDDEEDFRESHLLSYGPEETQNIFTTHKTKNNIETYIHPIILFIIHIK